MANDMSDTVRDALGQVVRGALKNASPMPSGRKRGPLNGMKGIATGVGLAAAAPLAKKGVDKLRSGGLPTPSASGLASKAGDQVGGKLKDTVSKKVDEAGGAGGLAKQAASGLLGGGGDGGGGGGNGGMQGVGKNRRMPIQQSVDVAVPIETAYNQWTQFEDWPQFMHRVTRVTQEDDCKVGFATKIWGKTKEFTADIETERPDERIKWKVSQGITHSGVVTFHELAPRLTRIEVNLDVAPGSLLEKAARGMRHIKRAVRADLHRFKAFIEMQEQETGAWRGVIEDGELVEQHDPSYDEEREYSDVEDLSYEDEASDDDSEDSDDDDERGDSAEDQPRARTGRFKRGAQGERAAASSRSSSSRSTNGNGSSRSSSGSSRSRSGSSRSSNGGNGSSSKRSSSSRARNGSSSPSSSRSSSSKSKNGGSSSSSSSSRRKASSRS